MVAGRRWALETRDEVFAQFLTEYLRLSPERAAFARRVMCEIGRGVSVERAAAKAAN